MINDVRDLWYLKNLLEYEKEQMEKANVSLTFFEYESVNKWLEELNFRIKEWENKIRVSLE